jgi:hypothetical protein
MLMMFVVHVGMQVHHGLVNVFVFVALCEVKPYSQPHEATGDEQLNSDGVSKRNGGDRRA